MIPLVRRCPVCYWERVETATNSSRKSEAAGPTQTWRSGVDVSGDESKIWCCKEWYCIGRWNVRCLSQGRLDVVKQEMARVNTNMLGVSEGKWAGMREFNPDDHYIYYRGQEAQRRNEVALTINKTGWSVLLGCNLKNDRMISVHFPGKPFNITVTVIPNHWCWRSWGWSVLCRPRRLPRISTKKDVLFIIGDWDAKVGSQEIPGVTGEFDLGIQNEAGQSLTEFCQEYALVTANIFSQQHKRWFYTWMSPNDNTKIRLIAFFVDENGDIVYSQEKQDLELTMFQIISSS